MILVTGGTGFVGRTLIRHLTALGKPVRILLRPSKTSPLIPRGVPVEVSVSSLKDERSLQAAMKGVDVVFHLAGSERASSRAALQETDVQGTEAIVQAASRSGVERIFYLSHLGAERASAYPVLKAKGLAEHILQQGSVPYTIFRSGAIFGPDDQFTTGLARLVRMSPGIFILPGDGSSLIQPIWVEDLVTCLEIALEEERFINEIVSIGGGEYLTFKQVIQDIMKTIGVRRWLLDLTPAYLRSLALWLEQNNRFPVSIYWLDYLAADRTTYLDTVPRLFGILPARFHQQIGYLKTGSQINSIVKV